MNKSILLVDDNVDFVEAAGKVLGQGGFDVVTATDGFVAADQLYKKEFGMMISDIVMPGMNGAQLFGYVKQRWPELKVIMVSGEATAVTRGRLKDLGADSFIEKPFRLQKLLAMVKSEMKAPVKEPEKHKKQVLVADDNRVLLGSVKEYLSAHGYEVTAVGDGSRAWQSVHREYPYYAIVLDLNMPRMGGVETVKAIRQIDGGVNIICISGEAFRGEIENIMEVGANCVLQKPFTMEKLISLMEKKVNRAAAISEPVWASQPDKTVRVHGIKIWVRQLNCCPVAVCAIVVALLAVFIVVVLSTAPGVAISESTESQINRLIRAVELDWGR